MTITRRAILRTGGATVVIAAAGGAGWALTRAPRAARAPWRTAAQGFGDPRLDALAYAILAPNPHNMQPWRIRLDGEDALTVFCALDRRLPETDPLDRQITIGFGCFMELLRQAAAEQGYRADISPFPEDEPQPRLDGRPVASVRLVADTAVERDPLFTAALERRTNREPYDTSRPVEAEALAAVLAAGVPGVGGHATRDAGEVAALRALTREAWTVEWTTPSARRESIAVTRIGKREINADPWGLALSGPAMEAMHALGMLTRERMDDTDSIPFREGLAGYVRACETAMAFVWTITNDNTRRMQLESGRAWVRMQLAATRQGLAFHPLSQALQEYPEMAALYRSVHRRLGAGEGEVVQMLSRLGFAAEVAPAPRLPLEAQLIPG